MKHTWALCILGWMTASPLLSQNRVDIFGYFESQFVGADVQHSFIQLYSNKLRVDLESRPSENIKFGANFDYITYHGKTLWHILDYLPENITTVVPEIARPFYVLSFDNRYFLDNAYVRLSLKYMDITVGKQQISPGTGYAWNPTDVFNTKDLLDPTYEQPGHNAVRLDVPMGSKYTLTTLYAPCDTWKESDKLIEFKGRISHFDYHLIAVEKTWRFHDYTQFNQDFMNPGFLEQPEKRRILGFSTAGELFGLGLWSEFGYNWMEETDAFYELVVGSDYTFDSGTYIMTEYYRNTLGKTDKQDYTLNDWMRFLAQEQKAIARDHLYALVQHPAMDVMTLGLSTIFSITDGSLALLPMMQYSPFQNVEILAYINLYLGAEDAVFNKNMGNGQLIRVRVYF